MSGKNISARKKQHRNMILDLIRMEPYTSRSSIKTLSGLSMETVLQHVDRLLKENLIYESGSGGMAVGRKATWLSINPAGRYFIGVKFSSIQLSTVALDFAGNVVIEKQTLLEPDISASALLALMMATIAETLDGLGEKRALVCGIGVGAPGVVDSAAGMLVRYASIKGLNNTPIQRMIESEFSLPTYIDHTLRVTTLAHKMRKENVNVTNMLYVVVKSGVGMVPMLNNKIYPGENSSAGEIGHLKVVRSGGRLCRCGRMGCLESEISYRAIVAKMEEAIAAGGFALFRQNVGKQCGSLAVADFLTAVEMDDPDALAMYNEMTGLLIDVVVQAVVLYNPHKIIFSGELMSVRGFLDILRREIWDRCPIETSSHLLLELSNQGDLFDAMGAGFLVMHEEYGTWGDALKHSEDPNTP